MSSSLRETRRMLGEAEPVYRRSLALIAPLWESNPGLGRRVALRVAIRLREVMSERTDVMVGVAMARPHARDVAEHSLKCGVLMTALVRWLGVERSAAIDAIVAALLHHAGQDTHGAFASERDASAQRRLMALLLAPSGDMGIYRQVLAGFQHELGQDGTGYPRMEFPVRQHPLAALLNVVNEVVELTSGGAPSGTARSPLTLAQAIRRMANETRERHHPAALAALVAAIGVTPLGTLVRLEDRRVALVFAYRGEADGWEADAVDIESNRPVVLGTLDPGAPAIDAVIDTSSALKALRSATQS